MSIQACRVMVNEVFDELGVDPAYKGKVIIEWNSRLTRALGRAHYKDRNGNYKIDLSVALFECLNDDEKLDTYVHEACHLADFILNEETIRSEKRVGKGKPHGPRWKSYMRRMGFDPERTCDIEDKDALANVKQSRRKKKRWQYNCRCSSYDLTTHKHKKCMGTYYYRCNKCSGVLKFSGKVTEHV